MECTQRRIQFRCVCTPRLAFFVFFSFFWSFSFSYTHSLIHTAEWALCRLESRLCYATPNVCVSECFCLHLPTRMNVSSMFRCFDICKVSNCFWIYSAIYRKLKWHFRNSVPRLHLHLINHFIFQIRSSIVLDIFK